MPKDISYVKVTYIVINYYINIKFVSILDIACTLAGKMKLPREYHL